MTVTPMHVPIAGDSVEQGFPSREATYRPQDIWVVIAAYNEDEAINDVLSQLSPLGYSIVVVDDGSRRSVAEFITVPRVIACRHFINLGQGAALQTGIKLALACGARFIVTFDADGQHRVEDIPALVAPIAEGRCDLALGSRFMQGGGVENISRKKLLTLKLAILFTRFLTGLRLTDTHNGLRAFSRGAAEKIKISQNRMSHATQILQEVARQDLNYVEVPVTIRYTEYSVRKGQRISNAFNIFWESLTELFQ